VAQKLNSNCLLFAGAGRPLRRNGAVCREGITPLKPADFSELQNYLRNHQPDVAQFRPRGPFGVEMHEDYQIPVTTERSDSDLAFSQFPSMTRKIPSGQNWQSITLIRICSCPNTPERRLSSFSCMDMGDRQQTTSSEPCMSHHGECIV
jgi:hypothetical protein